MLKKQELIWLFNLPFVYRTEENARSMASSLVLRKGTFDFGNPHEQPFIVSLPESAKNITLLSVEVPEVEQERGLKISFSPSAFAGNWFLVLSNNEADAHLFTKEFTYAVQSGNSFLTAPQVLRGSSYTSLSWSVTPSKSILFEQQATTNLPKLGGSILLFTNFEDWAIFGNQETMKYWIFSRTKQVPDASLVVQIETLSRLGYQ